MDILKERDLESTTEVDEFSDGPGSFTLLDSDGNPILVNQRVSTHA